VGDELLSGFKVNTNSSWIGQRLGELGIDVTAGRVVSDQVDVIAEAIADGLKQCQAVIVTGGLGPTSDDVTRAGLATFAGVEVARDARAEAALRARFEQINRPILDTHLVQVDLPVGSSSIPNSVGSAPGVRMNFDDHVVYLVPGPPREMQAVMETGVVPDLVRRRSHFAVTKSLRTALLPETQVAALLADWVNAHPEIAIAYLPSPAEVVVRLSATGDETKAVSTVLDAAAEDVREILGDAVVGDAAQTLAQSVVALLTAAGRTVAVAESLTGGLIAAAMTDVPGSSAVVQGGVVSYSTQSKHDLLGVESALLEVHGPVHSGVAREMAEGVRERFHADLGLATTGVAGPAEQDGKPVGTLHLAIASATSEVDVTVHLRGDRTTIRRQSVVHALDLLRRTILGLPPGPEQIPFWHG
jgi:nicotinamide-nucleotide amidase